MPHTSYLRSVHTLEAANPLERIMKILIAFFTPAVIPSGFTLFWQGIVSILFAIWTAGNTWFGSLAPILQILIFCMICDYLSGIYALTKPDGERGFWAEFKPGKAAVGIFRKIVIGILGAIALRIAGLSSVPGAEQIVITGLGLWCLSELTGTARNLRKGKFEGADDMDAALLKAREQFESRAGIQRPIVVKVEQEPKKE